MFSIKSLYFTGFLVLTSLGLSAASAHESDAIIAGYIENAFLEKGSLIVAAKMDTGANTSSINAPVYERYKKGDKEWVKFNFTDSFGKAVVIDRPILRIANIRRAGTAAQDRVVISLEMCVGGYTSQAQFTLADRRSQKYQILVGRRFMKEHILIHSAKSNLHTNTCNKRGN